MTSSASALDAPRLPPRSAAFDGTLALRADPYRFIGRECRRLGSDVFRARLLLRPAICMTGPDAAAIFYDPARFARAGAAPEPLRATLFGKGTVQGLDGTSHRNRKAMLMSLMTPERIDRLGTLVDEAWSRALPQWSRRGPIVLYDETRALLARAICEWAGVPLAEADVDRRTRQLTALFEGAGSAGLAHVQARLSRKALEGWLAGLVRRHRATPFAPVGSALAVVAAHRRRNAVTLDERVAAAELLNVLRPTVAIAVYVVFTAHALHGHPRWRARLRDEPEAATRFVHEVRRFYPFFPAVAARVCDDFEWNGHHFPRGTRTLLDLYGTDHDARCWSDPERFEPERFASRTPGPFELIAQGGAEHWQHHRCAGEWITIELMRRCALRLAQTAHDVPGQDLRIDFRRLPALPFSRFVMRVRSGE